MAGSTTFGVESARLCRYRWRNRRHLFTTKRSGLTTFF